MSILDNYNCPFDGQFNKCNNAGGCDCCKEYEEWLNGVLNEKNKENEN